MVFLTWQMLPQAPNDDFVDAQVISGPSGSVTGSTGPESVATFEPGEPGHANSQSDYTGYSQGKTERCSRVPGGV